MSIFLWGFGKNGQLGQGNRESSLLPVQISFAGSENVKKSSQYNRNSHKKDRSSGDDNMLCKSKCISAGGLMTCLLQTDGRVYSCGSGSHGRLGTGEEDDHLSAVIVDIPSIDAIIEVRKED